jgi:hypothetical protein
MQACGIDARLERNTTRQPASDDHRAVEYDDDEDHKVTSTARSRRMTEHTIEMQIQAVGMTDQFICKARLSISGQMDAILLDRQRRKRPLPYYLHVPPVLRILAAQAQHPCATNQLLIMHRLHIAHARVPPDKS